jgi:hypothetical protein
MNASPEAAAEFVRSHIPDKGLFAGMDWRIAPAPFPIEKRLLTEFEKLGRVLLQFNKAVNQIYRKSLEGKAPAWVADYLDRGKPEQILHWQRSARFKSEVPRVIRPDILLTDDGFKITELDSIPGGIGLTAWLNQTYSDLKERGHEFPEVVGNKTGMQEGFASIFPPEGKVHIVVSKESETYAPEMEWISDAIDPGRFKVRDAHFKDFQSGDNIYRFFELFDVPNVKNAWEIFARAEQDELFITPAPKAFLEEKMLLALLWNQNLREHWRQELGEAFVKNLQQHVPYSWVVDPTPLPPQGAFPELNLTDWTQLKSLSQKDRDLILKVSGFSDRAWGARGVYLGSDMSHAEWSEAVDNAVKAFNKNPFVLQRYHRPKLVEMDWWDFENRKLTRMEGRVRLCPYYFVEGKGDAQRARLCGILATICPADKKIIHGMRDAILAPVTAM